jgi:hypothetical protein
MAEELPAPNREKLLELPKEKLVDLLLYALEAQTLSTQNQLQLVGLLGKANEKIKDLESTNQNQEAELIVLRNS